MRVLLVDDHTLFLESLQQLLTANHFAVVGTAGDGFAALDQARALHPDLVLMDIAMPTCDGLTATRLIKAELPETQVVMLTASDREQHLFEAIKSGATGYLLKSLNSREFVRHLHQIELGEPPLSPGLAGKILHEFARQPGEDERRQPPTTPDESTNEKPLSARQTQVLTLVAQGYTYHQVAAQLHLSEATVRYHMAETIDRLHLENRAQVIAYARRIASGRRAE